jgi:hypothetical protein
LEQGFDAIFYSIKHFVSIFPSVCPLMVALRIAVYLYYKFVHGIQSDTWTAHARWQGRDHQWGRPPPPTMFMDNNIKSYKLTLEWGGFLYNFGEWAVEMDGQTICFHSGPIFIPVSGVEKIFLFTMHGYLLINLGICG